MFLCVYFFTCMKLTSSQTPSPPKPTPPTTHPHPCKAPHPDPGSSPCGGKEEGASQMDEAARPSWLGARDTPDPGRGSCGKTRPCQTGNGSGVLRAPVCNSELDNPTRKEPQRKLEGLLQLPKQQAPSRSPRTHSPLQNLRLPPEAVRARGRRT